MYFMIVSTGPTPKYDKIVFQKQLYFYHLVSFVDDCIKSGRARR